jgi:hypothetical protein
MGNKNGSENMSNFSNNFTKYLDHYCICYTYFILNILSRVRVTIDGVLDWILNLLTAYTIRKYK